MRSNIETLIDRESLNAAYFNTEVLKSAHAHTRLALERCKSRKGRSQTITPPPESSEASQHPGRHLWEFRAFTAALFSASFFFSRVVKIHGATVAG